MVNRDQNLPEPETFDNVVEDVVAKHGNLDFFISSVGVHTENVDFWSMNTREFDIVMDVNLKGTFFAYQSVTSDVCTFRLSSTRRILWLLRYLLSSTFKKSI